MAGVSEKFKSKVNNFFRNPISFILRQLYRILFVVPFEIIVLLISLFEKKEKVNQNTPSSYCFLVTSVIYSKENKKVSYGGARSIFTPEERAQQTINTIDKIRQHVPAAKIVLVEAGLRGDLPLDLSGKADHYLYVGDKKLVRWACDSTFKSLGESSMLLSVYKAIKKIKADFYFKISGRYFLSDDFNLADWNKGGFVLYFLQEDYISTRLYGFRKEMLSQWKYALIKGLPFSLIGYAIENTLAKFIPEKFIYRLKTLGVTGLSATVKNDLIKE